MPGLHAAHKITNMK